MCDNWFRYVKGWNDIVKKRSKTDIFVMRYENMLQVNNIINKRSKTDIFVMRYENMLQVNNIINERSKTDIIVVIYKNMLQVTVLLNFRYYYLSNIFLNYIYARTVEQRLRPPSTLLIILT